MTVFRRTPTTRWDEPWFQGLSTPARLLYLYLETSPTSGAIPGVVLGGPAAHAEVLRWDAATFTAAYDELAAQEAIYADWPARLAWLPATTEWQPPDNQNQLVHWIRFWPLMPTSASLTWRIHESLKRLLEPLLEVWKRKDARLQGSFDDLFPFASAHGHINRFGNPFRNRLINGLETDPGSGSGEEPGSGPGEGSGEGNTSRNGSSNSLRNGSTETPAAKPRRPDAYRDLADAIWSEQERLRRVLRGEGVSPTARALPHGLEGHRELLARISESAAAGGIDRAREDCEHVLAVCVAEARAIGSLQFFNGHQWQSKRWAVAMGMTPEEAAQRSAWKRRKEQSEAGEGGDAERRTYRPSGQENYQGGDDIA